MNSNDSDRAARSAGPAKSGQDDSLGTPVAGGASASDSDHIRDSVDPLYEAVRARRRSPSALARAWPVRQRVGGVPFVATSAQRAASSLVSAAIERARGEHVHLANAYSVALADEFPALAAQAFCSDGWNLPDGRPISWISRFRRDQPSLNQIRGPQFFLDVCRAGVRPGLQHYLLGARPEVLAVLESELRAQFPGIRIVGSSSPPFREPSDAELGARDRAIIESGAHVVWVGLGTPKQDIEAARLAGALPVVAVAVGAAFDYAAGSLQEAPRWMRQIGMEWVFRLVAEPRRLWRRYFFGNVRFIRATMRART